MSECPLVDALAVVLKHIEELERIASDTGKAAWTSTAQSMANRILDELIKADNVPPEYRTYEAAR